MLSRFRNLEIFNYEKETYEMPEIYDRELEDTITSTWSLTDKVGDTWLVTINPSNPI